MNIHSRATFRSFTALSAALVVGACSSSGGDPSSSSNPTEGASPTAAVDAGANADAPKAKPVTGTPVSDEITEQYGVFVSPQGSDKGAGTRASTLATVQAGIDRGKELGKRVYVCTGTYKEALTLADSVSVIGGLSCGSATWKTGAAPSALEAPTSPAVRAKDIASPTRIEGFAIRSPDAAEPSGSSIGLLADHAPALVIATSTIAAGNGADGANGTNGIQLRQGGSVDGRPSTPPVRCKLSDGFLYETCASYRVPTFAWRTEMGASSVSSTCVGAPGHNGGTSGYGGSGGLREQVFNVPSYWRLYQGSAANETGLGQFSETFNGRAGASRGPAAQAAPIGALGPNGYTPADGNAGADGEAGHGGYGGRGSLDDLPDADDVPAGAVFKGMGGPSGGAGGCPGLAGTAGRGGGASIAAALLESPIVFENVELTSGIAGAGGRGSFGSDPTPGGRPGMNASSNAINAAGPGGGGGAPGVSTHGSHGAALGIYYGGAAPALKATVIKLGRAAPAREPETHTDALGNTRVLPGVPAGLVRDSYTP